MTSARLHRLSSPSSVAVLFAVALGLCGGSPFHAPGASPSMLFVKQWSPTSNTLSLRTASIVDPPAGLRKEARHLRAALTDASIDVGDRGTPVRLALAEVAPSSIRSRYRDRIAAQAYRLTLAPSGILIEGSTPEAVFYGVQTLAQRLRTESVPAGGARNGEAEIRLTCGVALDWPDLPVRMIMIDPARQNENFDYYKRVIDFCARWKINAILCHLTDDQTSALYHPDYPELMHPKAWRPEAIRDLVDYAQARHIELVPEIESLGHSRMFLRRDDFREILHKTRGERTETWMGTDVPGFTNVLCPASDKTYQYLEAVYSRAAETFPNEILHIGCDEVDMTSCERCEGEFGSITKTEWFRGFLLRCREIAADRGRKIALWGDMLLKDPAILDGFPREGVVIYDWHYLPDVAPDSLDFFQSRGFEVVACPALVCAPHMIYPDAHNYENIRRFTAHARGRDCLGVNTTIWIPQRYMSDVLWPGIAFAAAHAWGGSRIAAGRDPDPSLVFFLRDFFGVRNDAAGVDAEDAARAWTELAGIIWHRAEFLTACWIDEAGIEKARKLLAERGDEVGADLKRAVGIARRLGAFAEGVSREPRVKDTLRQTPAILAAVLEHLQAAAKVKTGSGWNYALAGDLSHRGEEILAWIEADWTRNRYADDPNRDGLHVPEQHLLFRFRQMQAFHHSILKTEGSGK